MLGPCGPRMVLARHQRELCAVLMDAGVPCPDQAWTVAVLALEAVQRLADLPREAAVLGVDPRSKGGRMLTDALYLALAILLVGEGGQVDDKGAVRVAEAFLSAVLPPPTSAVQAVGGPAVQGNISDASQAQAVAARR